MIKWIVLVLAMTLSSFGWTQSNDKQALANFIQECASNNVDGQEGKAALHAYLNRCAQNDKQNGAKAELHAYLSQCAGELPTARLNSFTLLLSKKSLPADTSLQANCPVGTFSLGDPDDVVEKKAANGGNNEGILIYAIGVGNQVTVNSREKGKGKDYPDLKFEGGEKPIDIIYLVSGPINPGQYKTTFTGKIKRIAIKKRRVGSNFRINAGNSSDRGLEIYTELAEGHQAENLKVAIQGDKSGHTAYLTYTAFDAEGAAIWEEKVQASVQPTIPSTFALWVPEESEPLKIDTATVFDFSKAKKGSDKEESTSEGSGIIIRDNASVLIRGSYAGSGPNREGQDPSSSGMEFDPFGLPGIAVVSAESNLASGPVNPGQYKTGFRGKIKRIRIKQRRVGSDFRINAGNSSDPGLEIYTELAEDHQAENLKVAIQGDRSGSTAYLTYTAFDATGKQIWEEKVQVSIKAESTNQGVIIALKDGEYVGSGDDGLEVSWEAENSVQEVDGGSISGTIDNREGDDSNDEGGIQITDAPVFRWPDDFEEPEEINYPENPPQGGNGILNDNEAIAIYVPNSTFNQLMSGENGALFFGKPKPLLSGLSFVHAYMQNELARKDFSRNSERNPPDGRSFVHAYLHMEAYQKKFSRISGSNPKKNGLKKQVTINGLSLGKLRSLAKNSSGNQSERLGANNEKAFEFATLRSITPQQLSEQTIDQLAPVPLAEKRSVYLVLSEENGRRTMRLVPNQSDKNQLVSNLKKQVKTSKDRIVGMPVMQPNYFTLYFFKKGTNEIAYRMAVLDETAKGEHPLKGWSKLFSESDQASTYDIGMALPQSNWKYVANALEFQQIKDGELQTKPLCFPEYDAQGKLLRYVTKEGTVLTFYNTSVQYPYTLDGPQAQLYRKVDQLQIGTVGSGDPVPEASDQDCGSPPDWCSGVCFKWWYDPDFGCSCRSKGMGEDDCRQTNLALPSGTTLDPLYGKSASNGKGTRKAAASISQQQQIPLL